MSLNPRDLLRKDHHVIDKFLQFEEECIICEYCAQEFTLCYRLSSARRHIRKHFERNYIQFPAESEADSAESDVELDAMDTADFSESTNQQKTDCSEVPADSVFFKDTINNARTSQPEVLLALLFVRLALSERQMNIILEFLKLGLDFSGITNIKSVMRDLNTASCELRNICASCAEDYCGDECPNKCQFTEEPDVYVMGDLERQLQIICQGITDGEAYKSAQDKMREKLLVSPDSLLLTLILNTDGLQLYESSSDSGWPVFATICELPPQHRFLPDKILNVALWQGEGKLPLDSIILQFISAMNKINEQGIIIETKDGPVRAFVICPAITADLPAKAHATNMKQSGTHSCPLCEIKGKSVPSGRGNCTCFPVKGIAETVRRTNTSINAAISKAAETNKPCMGFKGAPRVAGMPGMDITTVALIDEMHGIPLGIVKKLMLKWTEDTDAPYHLSKAKIRKLQRRLYKYMPPNCIHRLPRQINTANWKASEFRNFLLHYCTSLKGILDAKYYNHWLLLAEFYKILCGSSITPMELNRCEILIEEFCQQVVPLYGEKTYGINFHNLLHLPEMVNNFGPLWCYSLFPFESKNGWIASHAHSKHSILNSVMCQMLCSQLLRDRTKLITDRKEVRVMKLIEGQRVTEGYRTEKWSTYSCPKKNVGEHNFSHGAECAANQLRSIATAVVSGVTLWAENYLKSKRRCCRYVLLLAPGFGRVLLEIMELVFCQTCKQIFIVGFELSEKFVAYRTMEVQRAKDRTTVIKADGIELKSCVPYISDKRTILSIVDEQFAHS